MAADLSPAAQSTSTTDASPVALLKQDPRAALEDAAAQLEIARQQRTEVSSELYKYRLMVDELKDQRVTLQGELARRLHLHKEDLERIQALQREMDHLRSSYSEKQAEIIELSTRVQELLGRVDSSEQQRELKAENELLWRKLNELKRNESAADPPAEAKAQLERWRARFVEIESAISEAYEERRTAMEPTDSTAATETCAQMLQAVLVTEETLRKSLTTQLQTLKTDLRAAKDQVEDLARQAALSEVASVRLDVELQKQVELSQKVTDLESDRENYMMRLNQLRAELDNVRTQLDHSKTEASRINDNTAIQLSEALRSIEAKDETIALLERAKRDLGTEVTRLAAETVQAGSSQSIQAENDALQRQISEERTTASRLAAANAALRAELETFKKDSNFVQDRVDQLEAEIATARMSADARTLEAKEKTQHLAELNERLRETNALLQAQYEKVSEQLRERTVEAEAANEEIEQQREEISELRSHLAAAQQNHDKVAGKGDIGAKLAILEAQRNDAVNALKDHEETNRRLTLELAEAQETLRAVQTDSARTTETMQAEMDTMQRQIHERQTEADASKEAIADLEKELEDLCARLQSAEAVGLEGNDSLRQELTTAEAASTKLKAELSAAEATSEELRAELTIAEATSKELKSQLDSLQEAHDAEHSRVLEMEAECALHKSHADELRASLEEALNGPAVETLMADNFKAVNEEQQITRLKTALNKAVATAKEQESLAEIARERVKERQTEVEELKKQIQRVEDGWKVEYDGYLGNLHRVNTALEKIAEEKSRLEIDLQKVKAALTAARSRTPPTSETTNTEREKWSQERKNLERSIDDMRRKLSKAQKEISEKTLQSRRMEAEHRRMALKSRAVLSLRSKTYAAMGGVLALWLTYVLGALSH